MLRRAARLLPLPLFFCSSALAAGRARLVPLPSLALPRVVHVAALPTRSLPVALLAALPEPQTLVPAASIPAPEPAPWEALFDGNLLDRAHAVGSGELGKDGVNPAGIGNYTIAQLLRKVRIAKKGAVAKTQRRRLMESGRLGEPIIPKLAGGKPTPARLERLKKTAEDFLKQERFSYEGQQLLAYIVVTVKIWPQDEKIQGILMEERFHAALEDWVVQRPESDFYDPKTFTEDMSLYSLLEGREPYKLLSEIQQRASRREFLESSKRVDDLIQLFNKNDAKQGPRFEAVWAKIEEVLRRWPERPEVWDMVKAPEFKDKLERFMIEKEEAPLSEGSSLRKLYALLEKKVQYRTLRQVESLRFERQVNDHIALLKPARESNNVKKTLAFIEAALGQPPQKEGVEVLIVENQDLRGLLDRLANELDVPAVDKYGDRELIIEQAGRLFNILEEKLSSEALELKIQARDQEPAAPAPNLEEERKIQQEKKLLEAIQTFRRLSGKVLDAQSAKEILQTMADLLAFLDKSTLPPHIFQDEWKIALRLKIKKEVSRWSWPWTNNPAKRLAKLLP